MNREAERHLAKAEDYLGKGDGWYRKAALEIVAAQKADTTLSNREIGERFGRSKDWVRQLVTWVTTGEPGSTSPSWNRGSHSTVAEIEAGAKRLLRDAPMEQVERLVADLPKERQAQIGMAAGDAYMRSRVIHEGKSPSEKKAGEAAGRELADSLGKSMSGFSVLSIVADLEHATSVLLELIAVNAITPEALTQIDTALAAFLDEYRVAQAMVGEEVGS